MDYNDAVCKESEFQKVNLILEYSKHAAQSQHVEKI